MDSLPVRDTKVDVCEYVFVRVYCTSVECKTSAQGKW